MDKQKREMEIRQPAIEKWERGLVAINKGIDEFREWWGCEGGDSCSFCDNYDCDTDCPISCRNDGWCDIENELKNGNPIILKGYLIPFLDKIKTVDIPEPMEKI